MEMARYVDQFDSRWIGVNFDIGNCMFVGWPEQWIARSASASIFSTSKEFSRKKFQDEASTKACSRLPRRQRRRKPRSCSARRNRLVGLGGRRARLPSRRRRTGHAPPAISEKWGRRGQLTAGLGADQVAPPSGGWHVTLGSRSFGSWPPGLEQLFASAIPAAGRPYSLAVTRSTPGDASGRPVGWRANSSDAVR